MVDTTAFENLKIGINIIDLEHLHIFEALSKINASTNTQEAIENTQIAYTLFVNHCITEEMYMRKINFPDICNHLKSHAELNKKFSNMIKRLSIGNDFIRRYFVGVLDTAFIKHIEYYDEPLGIWSTERGL